MKENVGLQPDTYDWHIYKRHVKGLSLYILLLICFTLGIGRHIMFSELPSGNMPENANV